MAGDYEVGRGRPPKSRQFRRGKSGNPRGRPKGAAKASSVSAELVEEMKETIIVRENGAERKITKQRAVLKALVTAAINGDIRAINSIVACTRNFGMGSEANSAEDPQRTDLDQFEILEAFVERERERRERERSKQPDGSKTSQRKV